MTTLFDIAGIQARIFHLAGRPPFMLAADLADVYGTEAKYVTRAVKRNPARFPERYAFRLTRAEEEQRWCQIGTTSPGKRADLEPLVFTHGGANMLSGVLKSPVADEMAVAINDAFTAMEAKALADTHNMLGKLKSDVLMRKPIYVKIRDALERGVSFDQLWRETNYSRRALDMAAREMLRIGMIDRLLPGMQADMFDG